MNLKVLKILSTGLAIGAGIIGIASGIVAGQITTKEIEKQVADAVTKN